MDILRKYTAVITGTIDGIEVAERLKNEMELNMSAYLTLLYMENPENQASEFVEMLIQQHNIKGVARLFQIIQRDYKDLASMIPELSNGERFSTHLGDGLLLKVLINDGEVKVDIMAMQVCDC